MHVLRMTKETVGSKAGSVRRQSSNARAPLQGWSKPMSGGAAASRLAQPARSNVTRYTPVLVSRPAPSFTRTTNLRAPAVSVSVNA